MASGHRVKFLFTIFITHLYFVSQAIPQKQENRNERKGFYRKAKDDSLLGNFQNENGRTKKDELALKMNENVRRTSPKSVHKELSRSMTQSDFNHFDLARKLQVWVLRIPNGKTHAQKVAGQNSVAENDPQYWKGRLHDEVSQRDERSWEKRRDPSQKENDTQYWKNRFSSQGDTGGKRREINQQELAQLFWKGRLSQKELVEILKQDPQFWKGRLHKSKRAGNLKNFHQTEMKENYPQFKESDPQFWKGRFHEEEFKGKHSDPQYWKGRLI